WNWRGLPGRCRRACVAERFERANGVGINAPCASALDAVVRSSCGLWAPPKTRGQMLQLWLRRRGFIAIQAGRLRHEAIIADSGCLARADLHRPGLHRDQIVSSTF